MRPYQGAVVVVLLFAGVACKKSASEPTQAGVSAPTRDQDIDQRRARTEATPEELEERARKRVAIAEDKRALERIENRIREIQYQAERSGLGGYTREQARELYELESSRDTIRKLVETFEALETFAAEHKNSPGAIAFRARKALPDLNASPYREWAKELLSRAEKEEREAQATRAEETYRKLKAFVDAHSNDAEAVAKRITKDLEDLEDSPYHTWANSVLERAKTSVKAARAEETHRKLEAFVDAHSNDAEAVAKRVLEDLPNLEGSSHYAWAESVLERAASKAIEPLVEKAKGLRKDGKFHSAYRLLMEIPTTFRGTKAAQQAKGLQAECRPSCVGPKEIQKTWYRNGVKVKNVKEQSKFRDYGLVKEGFDLYVVEINGVRVPWAAYDYDIEDTRETSAVHQKMHDLLRKTSNDVLTLRIVYIPIGKGKPALYECKFTGWDAGLEYETEYVKVKVGGALFFRFDGGLSFSEVFYKIVLCDETKLQR